MPTESIFMYSWLALYLIAVKLVSSRKSEMVDSWQYTGNIFKKATRDISVLGEYSVKTTISIKYWAYAIEVAMWRVDRTFSPIHLLRVWNYECNSDKDGLINDGIERAHTEFLKEIDEAREEKREPSFKVSPEYDFHVCPKSLLYNDYVDTEELLSRVDSFIGGESFG